MPLNNNATNEIQTFAFDADETYFDIMALADYITDVDRKEGVKKGIARRDLHNITLRQLSLVCVGLAQFVANRYAAGVRDNQNVDDIEAGILAAVQSIASTTLSNRSISTTSPLTGGGNLSANLNLGINQASTSQTGVTRMATDAEVIAGTSTAVSVTPKSLQQYVPGWDRISGKPSTFPPSDHDASKITSGILPLARGGTGNGTGMGYSQRIHNTLINLCDFYGLEKKSYTMDSFIAENWQSIFGQSIELIHNSGAEIKITDLPTGTVYVTIYVPYGATGYIYLIRQGQATWCKYNTNDLMPLFNAQGILPVANGGTGNSQGIVSIANSGKMFDSLDAVCDYFSLPKTSYTFNSFIQQNIENKVINFQMASPKMVFTDWNAGNAFVTLIVRKDPSVSAWDFWYTLRTWNSLTLKWEIWEKAGYNDLKQISSDGNALNSNKWGGKNIEIVSTLPSNPDANTIYFITD